MPRLAIVTGANQGIGLEIAKQLYVGYHDVQLVLACRSVERGEAAVDEVVKQEMAAGLSLLKPVVLHLDLHKTSSFKTFATEIQKLGGEVDMLINNAAVLDSPGLTLAKATDILTVNYINTVLFCETMVPLMRQGEGETNKSRIVLMGSRLGCLSIVPKPSFTAALASVEQLTSKDVLDRQLNFFLDAVAKGETSWNYGFAPAYCVSKALVMAWFRMQAPLTKSKQIGWFSCCPGYVPTNMTGYTSAATTPIEAAAATPVWLAAGARDSEIESGSFYGEKKKLNYI